MLPGVQLSPPLPGVRLPLRYPARVSSLAIDVLTAKVNTYLIILLY